MKKIVALFFVFFILFAKLSYSQQFNPTDLIGTWDETTGAHPATIIFLDSNSIRYSYKGHTGTSHIYYYVLNSNNSPATLKVDRNKTHTRNRNEYLIQMVDANTIKLQVLFKRDSRDHFDESKKDKVVTLVRRK
jgi:hypothetical protein